MIDMHGEGIGAVAGLLETVAHRALNPQPAFDAMTDRFVESERRRFGAKLKPLKAETVKRKARSKDPRTRSHAGTPLEASGRLEHFLTTKGASAQPLKLTNDELLLGVPGGRHDLHYARYQKKYGRNPLVSAATVRRFATRELATFLVRSPL